MKKENFANNLRALRKMNHETGDDLGLLLGYSKKNISKWENNESMPDYQTLTIIAKHYRVTLDDLIYGDYEQFLGYKTNFNDLFIFLIKMLNFEIKTDENDVVFNEAYDNMISIFFDNKLDIDFFKSKVEKILNDFEKAFETSGNYNAIINKVATIYLFSGIVQGRFLNKNLFTQVDSEEIEWSLFLHVGARDENSIINQSPLEVAMKGLVQHFEGYLLDAIYKLQSNKETTDLGNYYNCLRYLLNFVDNNNLVEENATIGVNLLVDEYKKDNKYVLKFVECIAEMMGIQL